MINTVVQPFRCRLSSRALLRVSGADATELLQGLFTNDVRLLGPGLSMYGCFLYFTGRVLCDAHLYHGRQTGVDGEAAAVIIDVHESMSEDLLAHLKEMKMRKKVRIEAVSDRLAVEVSYGPAQQHAEASASVSRGPGTSESFADARSFAVAPQWWDTLIQSQDPAVSYKLNVAELMSPTTSDLQLRPPQITRHIVSHDMTSSSSDAPSNSIDDYYRLLYSHGIGEGPATFKDTKSFPFEGNLDYLHGVSFHKGCYIGQELTHRTHVMLVTRKRTLPLVITHSPQRSGSEAAGGVGTGLFVREGKERVGELSAVVPAVPTAASASKQSIGVGLIRLRYMCKEKRTIDGLTLADGSPVHVSIPPWWPVKQVKKLLKNN